MRLRYTLLLPFLIFHINGYAQTSWNLIWSDEFSGNSLNLNHWSYEFGGGGWGNNEWVYYTNQPDNISVSSGTLKITAIRENPGPMEYQSARIITKDKFSFLYGKVEARMRMPMGQGLWPAFWMMGQNIDAVSWPSCGEIDVMEHVSNEPLIHGTVHWNHGGHTSLGDTYGVDVTEFHVYGAIWDEESIDFYVDGNIYFSFPLVAGNQSANTFDKPVFLLLNMAIGGNFPGYPDVTTIFPSVMEVDYVRVYQNFPSSILDRSDADLTIRRRHEELMIDGLNSENHSYSLVDMTGQKVLCGMVSSSNPWIGISSLAHGAYVLTICDRGSLINRKVVL